MSGRIDLKYPVEPNQPNDSLKALIKELANRRLACGITQLQLDAIIGVTEGLTAKWESGARLPSSFLLSCWAEALECVISLNPRN